MRMSRLSVLVVCAVGAFLCGSASAQPGPGGGGFGGFGGKMGLLFREDVRKELEIVDSQVEDARQAMQDSFAEMRNLGDLSQEERREKFQEIMSSIEKKVDEVLLPHQAKRLNEIYVQQTLNRGGPGGGLSSDVLTEALGITDAQKEELQKVGAEVREDLQKAIAEANEKARKKVLEVLTPAQQKKLEEMTGKPFEFSQQAAFGGGNFGGGRGGEGGGLGGGRGGEGGRPRRPQGN